MPVLIGGALFEESGNEGVAPLKAVAARRRGGTDEGIAFDAHDGGDQSLMIFFMSGHRAD